MNDDCIFCKIVAGDIPSTVVAETNNVFAFRDVNPAAPVHVLVIPKQHVADSAADLGTGDGQLLEEIFSVAGQIAASEDLDGGWRLVTNVGAGAGQTVFHVHFHLMGGWGNAARPLAEETGG